MGAEKEALWTERAALCELLALSLRYPDAELVEAIISGEWEEAAREIAALLELDLPESFAQEGLAMGAEEPLDDAQALGRALRTEASRLFIGMPEAAVSPYESVWRANATGAQPMLFASASSVQVERFFAQCGLGRPDDTNEPLDHIATELELLMYIAAMASEPAPSYEAAVLPADLPGGSSQAAWGRFFDEHVCVWSPQFSDALESQARLPFYRAVAQLLRAFAESRP